MSFATVKYAHLLSLLVLICASGTKNSLLWQPSVKHVRLTQSRLADRLSAVAAGLMVLTGLALIAQSYRPSIDYLTNYFFIGKIALLIFASALILSTKNFLATSALSSNGTEFPIPKWVRLFLKIDFICILVMAFIGISLTNGIGFAIRNQVT